MQDKTPQQIKQLAIGKLKRVLPGQREQLRKIDPRLLTYFDGLQDEELHNVSGVLGGVKFLRVLRTYGFSHKRVSHAIHSTRAAGATASTSPTLAACNSQD